MFNYTLKQENTIKETIIAKNVNHKKQNRAVDTAPAWYILGICSDCGREKDRREDADILHLEQCA